MNKFTNNILVHKIKKLVNQWLFPPGKPFVYVAIGDSSVEGIGASRKHRTYPGIIYEHVKIHHKESSYTNLGKAHATINDMIEKQLDHAISLQPDLVTVSIGANDILLKSVFLQFFL